MKRYYRGLTNRDMNHYGRTGRFPKSDVPVFLDNEVAKFEGDAMPPGDAYESGEFLNVVDDAETARGYGPTLIWVDGNYVDATPSGKYGVVQEGYVRRSTLGNTWDFVEKPKARQVVEECCSSGHGQTRTPAQVHRTPHRRP